MLLPFTALLPIYSIHNYITFEYCTFHIFMLQTTTSTLTYIFKFTAQFLHCIFNSSLMTNRGHFLSFITCISYMQLFYKWLTVTHSPCSIALTMNAHVSFTSISYKIIYYHYHYTSLIRKYIFCQFQKKHTNVVTLYKFTETVHPLPRLTWSCIS